MRRIDRKTVFTGNHAGDDIMKRILLFCLAASALALLSLPRQQSADADTIQLKNGATIYGKLVRANGADLRSDQAKIVFQNGSSLTVPASTIESVVENELDQFVRAREKVGLVTIADRQALLVTTKESERFYGAKTYIGWESADSNDKTLVLDLRGGGELRLPRTEVASSDPISQEDAGIRPAIAESTRIPTTHRVTLENGRTLIGNLIETPEEEPLELRLGNLGSLHFARADVTSVEAVEDVYELPAATAAIEAATGPDEAEGTTGPAEGTTDSEIPAETIDELRKELRREILHEILDELLGEKIDDAVGQVIDAQQLRRLGRQTAELEPERILEIQYLVRELMRHRTKNRVRAEVKLLAMGAEVVPYLEVAASHPFELTRRAVQRILRDTGAVEGTPLAIEALNDSDYHVRDLAQQALRRLLSVRIAYAPDGHEAARKRAQSAYEEHWLSLESERLRGLLAERTRDLLAGE